jgi:hypothetical protein
MTLDQLAIKHGTDKSSLHHNYCDIYEQYFAPYKDEPIKFVEIGFGGYEYPDRGGESLSMWCEYFTQADIHCIELHQKIYVPIDVCFHNVSQVHASVVDICKGTHIVIDDGGHTAPLVTKSFELIWPVLARGGIYVIEDVETSYGEYGNWAGGAPLGDHNHPTGINLCKWLVDNVNCKYNGAIDEQVKSIHFHSNVVIIKKK